MARNQKGEQDQKKNKKQLKQQTVTTARIILITFNKLLELVVNG